MPLEQAERMKRRIAELREQCANLEIGIRNYSGKRNIYYRESFDEYEYVDVTRQQRDLLKAELAKAKALIKGWEAHLSKSA